MWVALRFGTACQPHHQRDFLTESGMDDLAKQVGLVVELAKAGPFCSTSGRDSRRAFGKASQCSGPRYFSARASALFGRGTSEGGTPSLGRLREIGPSRFQNLLNKSLSA